MIHERTTPASAQALLLRAKNGTLQPNRALAEKLGVTHRVVFEMFVRDGTGPERPLTPEEKLLRAIFGEKADQLEWLPEVGAQLFRGDLFEHRRERWFYARAFV